ncbi:MAG TPA: hypothetical protein IGS53_01970 [Leptolyngbyaceae cyanobacterium M33_DOE_097]|uniref:Uncharacterized protein n=1 Tax=Oscillatoriales cyanobacterium SpSt-418 TaxID=2282169 RepID=A0A7C3PJ94_9CYAN|nr:hypothetical protein [Leptolyngbyaceae cyanobacterium M33_DOE_097]
MVRRAESRDRGWLGDRTLPLPFDKFARSALSNIKTPTLEETISFRVGFLNINAFWLMSKAIY